MDFDAAKVSKFLRIDGNHRLSAVNESSSYKETAIPFCFCYFMEKVKPISFAGLFFIISIPSKFH